MPIPIQTETVLTWDATGRWIFPQDRLTFYYSRVGDPILMPPQIPIVIYTDPEGTHLAPDLRWPADGAVIAGSTIQVGPDGLVQEFYGAVGVQRYYAKPLGATVTYPLDAEFGPIIQALEESGSTNAVLRPDPPLTNNAVMVWDTPADKPKLAPVLLVGNIPNLSSIYDAAGLAQTKADAAQAAAIAAAATDATNKADAAKAASIPLAQKDAASGVPSLDGSSKLKMAQVPSAALTELVQVGSQSAMLSSGAQAGDIAVRTDVQKTFFLSANPATTLANWVELPAAVASAVISVDGQTGVVSLSSSYAAKTHATQHASAGADPITPAAIGAETPAAAQTKADAAQAAAIADAATKYLPTTQKGAASGLATLDSGSKVPTAQLPTLPYDASGAASTAQAAAIADAATKYVPLTQRAAANGVATLDGSTHIPTGQIPSLSYDASGAASAAQSAAISAAATDATTKASAAQSAATTAAASDAATKYVPKTLVTTKGDLVAASGTSTPARLPVGADGQFLVADSAQGTGIRWASIASEPVVYYDTGSSSYPSRPVGASPVMWVGPVAPIIGGLGAVDGLDFWRKTP